jgi:hypothetical protein
LGAPGTYQPLSWARELQAERPARPTTATRDDDLAGEIISHEVILSDDAVRREQRVRTIPELPL